MTKPNKNEHPLTKDDIMRSFARAAWRVSYRLSSYGSWWARYGLELWKTTEPPVDESNVISIGIVGREEYDKGWDELTKTERRDD